MESPPTETWRFPRAFWVANVIELFERAAYYGMFIALAFAALMILQRTSRSV